MSDYKILYCTIAVGDYYLESAINISKKLNQYSNNHHMLIVSNIQNEFIKNTTFVVTPENQKIFINNGFNYMMKYYPLYLASEMVYDYIIFIDADWRIRDTYDSSKINSMIQFMNDNEYDMFFERPHKIGHGKHNGINCFWQHKIDFYKLKETDKYDSGHVCNEQFMVFKKNEKFNLFVNKFKELYEISSKANLWPFAEGLEIGMSMAHSNMKCDWLSWGKYISGMFEFNSKDGGLNIRF